MTRKLEEKSREEKSINLISNSISSICNPRIHFICKATEKFLKLKCKFYTEREREEVNIFY